MSVVVSVEDVGACRKQVRIAVPAPAVEAETQRVVQEFRKRARLPGFRKGKVPVALVEKRFRDDIDKEVVERLVPRYWRQAQAESEVDPLLPPEVSEVELTPGAALTFSATVEIRPPIELGDIESFDLPDPPVEPTDEEIEEAIEDLRRNVAEWIVVERPAGRGDLVEGDLVDLEDAEAERPTPVSFEVGDSKIWEELSLAVSGAEAGREIEFERREGEGSEARQRRLRIRVNAVKERDLPPLDDEFAAKVGPFENLEGFRQGVRERMLEAKKADRRRDRESKLLEQLRSRHPIDLPAGVVEREVRSLMQDYAEGLAQRGVNLERAGIDWEQMAASARPEAQRRVHSGLLLDAVAERFGVEIEASELEVRISRLARARGESSAKVRKQLDETGGLEELRAQLRRGKAIARLMGDEAAEEMGSGAAPETESGEEPD